MSQCKSCEFWNNPGRKPETFWLLGMEWNVDRAREITRDRETFPVLTERFRGLVAYPEDPNEIDMTKVAVDPEHLDHVSGDPILLGQARIGSGRKLVPFVLDGHHRIARAIRDGVKEIRCRMLTEQELAGTYCGKPELNPHSAAPASGRKPGKPRKERKKK